MLDVACCGPLVVCVFVCVSVCVCVCEIASLALHIVHACAVRAVLVLWVRVYYDSICGDCNRDDDKSWSEAPGGAAG